MTVFFFSIKHGIIFNEMKSNERDKLITLMKNKLYKRLEYCSAIERIYRTSEYYLLKSAGKITVKQHLEDIIYELNISEEMKDKLVLITHFLNT